MNNFKHTSRLLNSTAVILIALAIVLSFFSQAIDFSEITAPFEALQSNTTSESIMPQTLSKSQKYYIDFKTELEDFEKSIVAIDNPWIFVSILLALFLSKSLVSLIPISITCLLSGIVFDFPAALLINFIGIFIIITVKYFWGRDISGGKITKIINKSPAIMAFLNENDKPNPWALFIFRLVPSFPINPVSQFYGSLNYSFKKYTLISLAGFLIKIVSFTCIGCNIQNPFSAAFVVPLITIMLFSGFSILIVNFIIHRRIKIKNRKNKESCQDE